MTREETRIEKTRRIKPFDEEIGIRDLALGKLVVGKIEMGKIGERGEGLNGEIPRKAIVTEIERLDLGAEEDVGRESSD